MRTIKLPIRRPWIPYIIFILALLITSLFTLYVVRATDQLDRLRFESIVIETQNTIENRVETYIAILRGGAGLLAANPDVTKDQFASYVTRLYLHNNYPGVQGIGYIEHVPAAEKDAFIAQQRNNGMTNFDIHPQRESVEYYPIIYLEPDDFRNNQLAVGFDPSTDPVRWEAMQRARDTGARAASGKVTLSQGPNEKRQAGFLIYLPVYESGTIPTTIDERRKEISGFIYAPFRSDDLLNGIIGDESKLLIKYQIYTGDKADPKNLLHDSSTINKDADNSYHPRFTSTKEINVAGVTWTLVFSNNRQFENTSQRGLAPVILLSGLLMSFILFLLSRSQFLARTTAEDSAIKLRASQKDLQRAIGLRDNFISIASHELKTPVTSMKVYAEVMLRTFTMKGDTRSAEYMEKMKRQIDKLTVLIQDLLDVSRLQSGKLAFREEAFLLDDLVKEIIENTIPISNDHEFRLKGKTKHPVWGDRDRIGQVISNFLTNAVKYSPKAKYITVTLSDEDNGVLLAVKDSGIGIDKRHLKKIFNRFYRVSDTDEQTYPGLGMGLYICHEIIKRHGGTIHVDSVKGKGSTFSFIIPYSKKKHN